MTHRKTSILLREDVLVGLMLILVALVIRLLFIGTPLASDDAIYFDLAAKLGPGIFDTATAQWPFRTGMVVPLAASQKLLGYSLAAYYLFSVGFSVLLVALVYLIMLRVAGLRAAVIATAVFMSSALALYHGTQVLPDTPNLCGLLAAFYVFIRIDDTKGRRNLALLALAAAFAFYAHLVRMPNSVFLAALPVYELVTHRSLRRTLIFSSFLAGFIALECVFYLAMTGNPFKRIMLVPKGVTLWIVHQAELSWGDYLWGPFRDFLRWKTGWFLLLCAIPGTFIAIRQRRAELIGLAVGGFLLFAAYSYPVTSFSPLVRALPLQPRYIVGFTCVLALLAGNLLFQIPLISPARFRKAISTFISVFLVAWIALQTNELRRLPNTMFFTDDAFFVGDRLTRDYLRQHKVEGEVYAYPGAVFQMFRGFSKLDIVEHSPTQAVVSGRHYLIHKPRVIRSVRAARIEKKNRLATNGSMLLNESPMREVLFETSSIALFYLRPHTVREVVDLAAAPSIWSQQSGISITEDRDNEGLVLRIDELNPHAYLSMFADPFTKPSHESGAITGMLKPLTGYRIEMKYSATQPLRSLRIFMRQYDDEKSLEMVEHKLSSAAGEQTFTSTFATPASFASLRIFLRFANTNENNEFHIKSLTLSELVPTEKETP